MQINVLEYSQLTDENLQRLNQETKDLSLNSQLWFLSLLADSKVKVFVFNDFETILFVPYRKKLGITYAYMPNFIQKLAFIGSEEGIQPITQELIRLIRFGEISLENGFNESVFDYTNSRKNYTLNLLSSYRDLKRNFSENHKRNCSKVKHVIIQKVDYVDGLTSIFKTEKASAFSANKIKEIEKDLRKLERNQILNDQRIILNAYENESLIASALFIHFNNSIYYLLGSSIKSNLKLSSKGLFAIFDYLIEKFAETETILDFEGSDIPGIARFFKGFGATENSYSFVSWNKLPFPINQLKKQSSS